MFPRGYLLPRALVVGSVRIKTAETVEDSAKTRKKKTPVLAKGPGLVGQKTTRENIKGRSSRSVRSLSQVLSSIACPEPVFHVTFTYPSVFPTGKAVICEDKRQLFQAGKRAGLCGVWVQEVQQRGAVHWHCLVYGDGTSVDDWCRWWRGHGGGFTCVTPGSEGAAVFYFALHSRKKDQVPDRELGRWWGYVDRRKLISFTRMEPVEIPMHVRITLRRWFRRYLRSKGVRRRSRGAGEANTGFTWFLLPADQERVLKAAESISESYQDKVKKFEALQSDENICPF